ncbi:endonuclease/exonuclease/phosphatase family protein [Chitinophaga lutea]
MRRLFIFAALLTLACNKPNELPPDTGGGNTDKVQVKVMTFNIYGARASSGTPANLAVIAKIINDEKPDLVALQEVDAFTQRSGATVHQARDLAALTGMEWYFTKAMELQGGEYGDAVLSRLPIKSSQRFALGVDPQVSGEPRSVAMIQVHKEGKDFYFASTHFDHLSQENSRLLQAQQLKDIVGQLSLPLIIGGDFNALPASQTVTALRSFLNMGCMQQCPLTFPSDAPNRTIDYIFTAPNGKFTVSFYNAITGYHAEKKEYASDHRPVVSIIKIN